MACHSYKPTGSLIVKVMCLDPSFKLPKLPILFSPNVVNQ